MNADSPDLHLTQSELALENELLAQLTGLGYAPVAVTDEPSMLANLKSQLEAFNGVTLTPGEFTKVLNHLTKSSGVFAKAKTLRDRMKLARDDGETVYLVYFVHQAEKEPAYRHTWLQVVKLGFDGQTLTCDRDADFDFILTPPRPDSMPEHAPVPRPKQAKP